MVLNRAAMTAQPATDLTDVRPDSWGAALVRSALRIVPSLRIPPSWLGPRPALDEEARGGGDETEPHIEVVSHCWQYAHLLVYQLSSLVLAPPQRARVTMTVCYCPEDEGTQELLDFMAVQEIPRVRWNWIALPREALLRRAVGRNLAARASQADWVWFTDCDVVFAEGCFDALATAVRGRQDRLVFPQEERCTRMLPPDDPVLTNGRRAPAVRTVEWENFSVARPRQATGPLQIARGDIARVWGYCGEIGSYQRTTDRWRKTYEDRVFRWLLGTPGTALDIPGVYRIKHIEKGRYQGGWRSRLRSYIRRRQEREAATS